MPNYSINGFGRIGRNVLRAMSQEQVERVVAINDLTDTHTLAHLLKWDSVHGKFDGEISYDDENIIVRGHEIRIFKERDPANLPWKKLNVDVVLESTGFFTSRDKAELHLKAGANRVLISAPAKDPDVTICIGVNDNAFDPDKDKIVSNASCTTNCLAPMAKVLNDNFGIAHGFMSTIHSYTNDQRILDFPHKDLRRARAAAINIIPSTTGAAKAIGEVIPDLKGKLNGGAFRVPTPDGSVTDFTAVLEKDATVDAVNAAFKEAASAKSYKGVVEYSDEALVSTDIVGNPHSCIFDSQITLMLGNRFVKVVGWYDNEWGYSNRCVELMEMLAE
jgi:glyceraldehyde 3-phosphate dehydrogenase (phosphorylating)